MPVKDLNTSINHGKNFQTLLLQGGPGDLLLVALRDRRRLVAPQFNQHWLANYILLSWDKVMTMADIAHLLAFRKEKYPTAEMDIRSYDKFVAGPCSQINYVRPRTPLYPSSTCTERGVICKSTGIMNWDYEVPGIMTWQVVSLAHEVLYLVLPFHICKFPGFRSSPSSHSNGAK